MRKSKTGDIEPPSKEEISEVRDQYTKDTILYCTDQSKWRIKLFLYVRMSKYF